MKLRISLFAVVLLWNLSSMTAAQVSVSRASARFQVKFVAAAGKELNLVKHELKSHPSDPSYGVFWLAHVKAKSLGDFVFQYSFKPKDKHYSHVERVTFFTVAPKDCRRGVPSFGVYSRFCIGDTIIIPVFINGRVEDYHFSLRRTPPAAGEDWRTFEEKHPQWRERDLDKSPVANPLEILQYIGRRAHKAFHRSPGYTLGLEAHFEAIKPGRFNLLVRAGTENAEDDTFDASGGRSLPIVVVARGAPVTLIAGREEVRGFTMGQDGREYVSSTTSYGYSMSLLVLQPGDRISRPYLSVRRDGRFEREGWGRDGADPAEATLPAISALPFSVDPKWDYSGWLLDYLP